MFSLRSSFLAITGLLASIASAAYYIDPDSVSPKIRNEWCQSQISSCALICSQYPTGDTELNTCNRNMLTYGCICGGSIQPNMTEFALTLPYFTCVEWGIRCNAGCGEDIICLADCIVHKNPCGALDPATLLPPV